MPILEILSLVFSSYCIIHLIQRIGKKIIIQETIVVYTCINYLVMPVIVYQVFNEKNKMAVLWETFMPINSFEYFSIVLPAVIGLTIGLFWRFKRVKFDDEKLLSQAKEYLLNKAIIGYSLIVLGGLSGFFVSHVPITLKAVFHIGSYLIFVGVFYLLFSNIRFKWLALLFAASILIVQVINSAMYGELVFWSFFAFIYLMLGKRKLNLISKLILVSVGIYSILLIQSIKHEYRK